MPTDDIVSMLDLLALPIPAFVNASYYRLLGRGPDPAELQKGCGALRAGQGRPAFLADLSISTEFRDRYDGVRVGQSDGAFLEDVYQRYLGRQIDPQGMDKYLHFLARGKSRRRLVRQIAKSREASMKRMFWIELEELLVDERSDRHWFWRWPGRKRRRDRRHNQMVELTLHHFATQATQTREIPTAVYPLDVPPNAFAALGADARRVLSRACQVANTSSWRA